MFATRRDCAIVCGRKIVNIWDAGGGDFTGIPISELSACIHADLELWSRHLLKGWWCDCV